MNGDPAYQVTAHGVGELASRLEGLQFIALPLGKAGLITRADQLLMVIYHTPA